MRPIMLDQTPERVSVHVLSFCRTISRDSAPQYLNITPENGALQSECYENVLQKCARDGGALQYGWAIWTWPKVWLKAEHHAVWRNPSGALVDVTPNTPGCDQLLFLSDSTQSHDPSRMTHVPSRWHPLNPDPDILAVAAAERAIVDFQNESRLPGSREVRVNKAKYDRLLLEKEATTFRVVLKNVRKSQPCLCGSGLKFLDCHHENGIAALRMLDELRQLELNRLK